MAFSYVGNNSAATNGATSLTCSVATGVAVGDLIVAVFGFEGVALGSGPWIIPNIGQFPAGNIGPAAGWLQACWQGPNATGVGIEVWVAIFGTGVTQKANFSSSLAAVTVTAAYSGAYNPTGSITSQTVRLATTAQVTGNAPPAPSVNANAGELVIACGGDLMGASGFGTPSGFTNRIDAARSGAGTVEATIADTTTSSPGSTGPITFPNVAATGATAGTTATLAVRPAPASGTGGTGGVINAGMPEDLDIGSGYTLRVTAIDPVTGDPVTGVTASNVILTADQIAGSPEGLEVGPWALVPGPGA